MCEAVAGYSGGNWGDTPAVTVPGCALRGEDEDGKAVTDNNKGRKNIREIKRFMKDLVYRVNWMKRNYNWFFFLSLLMFLT